MPTTIDSLQIEIQSNSTSAANGINNLAKALGRLKDNGKITTAINNLNKLSTELGRFSSVNSNSAKISALATSLGALAAVGKIPNYGNTLSKLGAGLKTLETVNVDGLAPKFQAIADAASKLSGVRAGGISTMINALAKIGKVTDELSDEKIDAFADRVAKLNAKLAPLSATMTTVQAGLRGLNASFRQTGNSAKQMGSGVNTARLNLASLVTVVQGAIAAIQPIVRLLASTISQAMEWDGIEYQFGNAFGEQADMYYEKITQISDALSINKQTFMGNSAMATSMLVGFGVTPEDARKMGVGYTELAYDIWAAYNNVYKSLEGADGAMAAVRSAIAGEVEPIRRAGFTIVDSQLAITAANHGIAYSTQSATEEMKSYLRYLTLVEQAQSKGIVGTFASEMSTAEGMVRTFSQQVKSLAQAFGSLFIPVLVKVMPYVQAFVELLTDAVHWLASLFGITIQAVDFSDYYKGVGGIGESAEKAEEAVGGTTKALKELKNATLGIDELNIISPPDPAKGGGGSGGADAPGFSGIDVETLWDDSIFANIQSQVDAIKEKFKEWLPVIGGVASILGGLSLLHLVDQLKDSVVWSGKVVDALKGIGKAAVVVGISLIVGKMVWDFTGAYLENGDEASLLKALGTTALGAALAAMLAGPVGGGIVLMVSGVAMLQRLWVEWKEGTVDLGDPEAIVTALIGAVEVALGALFTWKTIGPVLKKAFSTLWPKITTAISGAASSGSLGAAVSAALPVAGAVAIAAAIIGWISVGFIDYDFTDFGKKVGTAIGNGIKGVTDFVANIGSAIWDKLADLGTWLVENVDLMDVLNALNFIFTPYEWIRVLKPHLKTWADKIGEAVGGYVENLAGNFGEFQDGFIEGLKESLGLDDDSFIVRLFKEVAWDSASEMLWDLLLPIRLVFVDLGAAIFPGFYEGIRSKWEDLKKKISNIFENLITWVKKILGIASPSKRFAEIGKACVDGLLSKFTLTALRDKLKAMWENAKTWWNTKKGKLATYTPSIGGIVTKLSNVWAAAKTWWNKKKGKLVYTPAIGGIVTKVSSVWSAARTWWNNKKGNFSTYTPKIGSITTTLQNAWNAAKRWWNKNVKLSIPSLSFKVTYSNVTGIKGAIVKALGLSGWPKLSFAAGGGIFDMGSLIWAGERGPEVVANAGGGKTGVMNVDQMSDAVYEGVYAAVVAAMRSNSGNGGAQSYNIYLDGKQITAAVEQRQRERGATIMGNQVYSY